ncbi:MAG: hypothetical protein LBR31_02415 [Desulfovibrio sp.]|jgi:hypothetical protein|nr:hypothetical protein [Desulfovibrio sp.]
MLPHLREAPRLPDGQKHDPLKAYAAHRRAMLKAMPDAEASRLDPCIALCMREKGFTREVVLATILQCAAQEQTGRPDRDWRRYAERTTAYAFGTAGDVKLAQSAVLRGEARLAEEQRPEPPRFPMR